MAKCRGEFSEETRLRLQTEAGQVDRPLARGVCEACGATVTADHKGPSGWLPKTHQRPQKYDSGKGGSKR